MIGALTNELARRAVQLAPAAGAAANDFRASGAALQAAAGNPGLSEADWHAALAEWRSKLTALAEAALPGRSPLELMLDAIHDRLPPIPGLDRVLSAVPATAALDRLDRWRDDLRSGAELGPLSIAVAVPSATARRAGAATGEVIGFLPPSGLSIKISGPAKGGGTLSFSDQPHWRLTGAFGMALGPLDVTAAGILERPGGQLSLLLLLGARFTPGIQLGFGFQIAGVGGLIGVNRRADTDALRTRLASGQATAALFPDDPVANGPAILETLGALFVPAPGSFVVGPTLQLSWLRLGTLSFMHLDVGVFIEMPGPARIVVVGRAVADIPGLGIPLLHLQLDVVGELDFVRGVASIRAALVNSTALGLFRAAGDGAMIWSWGPEPYQVLTIGGFYPGFNPAPAVVAPLRRIALSNDFDALPGFSMRFEAYLAVTSNTFQIGGRLELGLNIGLTAKGYVNLDALFQFRPFRFDVDIQGELRVGVLGRTFAGVDVSGHITGPGPLVVRAAISIDLWLTDFTWSDTFTIGRTGAEDGSAISLVAALAADLGSHSLHARGSADPFVAVTPAPVDASHSLVSPVGQIVLSQRSAPLNLRLERFGGLRLAQPTTAEIGIETPGIAKGERELDLFAPGTFLDLTVSEALSQQPFDRLDAGFELLLGPAQATGNGKRVTYQEYYRGRPSRPGSLHHFDALVLSLMGNRRAAPVVTDLSPLVTVRDEAWVTRAGDGSATPAPSRTAAHVAVRTGAAPLALPEADRPVSLAGVT